MNDNWILTEVNKCLYVLPNCDLVLFLTPISKVRILFCNDNKLLSILNDKSKFKQLQEDPTEKREASLQRYLRLLHKQGVFPEETYNKIRPCGSNPSRIYGLPKIHKYGAPLRPIVSAIGSYSHNLAKYLTGIIKPYAINEYTVALN